MKHRLLLAATLCCLVGNSLAAGSVYRCGPDGRVFSQMPCAGGSALDLAAPPSAEQQAQARRIAARDQRLADEMERSRHAEEAALEPAGAAALTVREPRRERKAHRGEADSRKWYTKPRGPSSKKKQKRQRAAD